MCGDVGHVVEVTEKAVDSRGQAEAHADKAFRLLKDAGVRVKVDDRDKLKPGAKYFEWDEQNYETAISWAQTALLCLSHWPADWRRDRAWEEIEHRISRLKKKIDV